jgi:hypothetical protein
LIFLAGVLRMVINDMNQSEFKQFVVSLVHHSKKSPFRAYCAEHPFLRGNPILLLLSFCKPMAPRWPHSLAGCRGPREDDEASHHVYFRVGRFSLLIVFRRMNHPH